MSGNSFEVNYGIRCVLPSRPEDYDPAQYALEVLHWEWKERQAPDYYNSTGQPCWFYRILCMLWGEDCKYDAHDCYEEILGQYTHHLLRKTLAYQETVRTMQRRREIPDHATASSLQKTRSDIEMSWGGLCNCIQKALETEFRKSTLGQLLLPELQDRVISMAEGTWSGVGDMSDDEDEDISLEFWNLVGTEQTTGLLGQAQTQGLEILECQPNTEFDMDFD